MFFVANAYRKLESLMDITVSKMRHADARSAQKTIEDAGVKDPLQLYAFNTPDEDRKKEKRGRKKAFSLTLRLSFHYSISSEQRIALTVPHGVAIVLATFASNSKQGKRRTLDRIMERLNPLILKFLFYFLSPEQRKRRKEVMAKIEKLINTLGDDQKDMIHLNLLGTAPAFQRLGYGGALVEAINDIADSQGRRTFLVSSNIDNTEFYNSHGFYTTATEAIGDDNPTWDEEPYIISLMVREGGKA